MAWAKPKEKKQTPPAEAKLSEVASQDSALFQLLASPLPPTSAGSSLR